MLASWELAIAGLQVATPEAKPIALSSMDGSIIESVSLTEFSTYQTVSVSCGERRAVTGFHRHKPRYATNH